MDQLYYFFANLFDSSSWTPRWLSGRWDNLTGWLYIISDLAVAAAYISIPIFILKYIRRKKSAQFIRLYYLFAAFLLCCSFTYLLSAYAFWNPLYRLSALLRFITGFLSWIAVYYIVKYLPLAFSLPSLDELKYEIDQRKKAEEEVLELNLLLDKKVAARTLELSQYRYALDESSMVAITDEDGKFIYVNENFCRSSKYATAEIIGRNYGKLNAGFHTADFEKELWNTLHAGRIWKGEIKSRAKDGSYFWMDATVVPLVNDGPAEYMAISRDITERKEIEAQKGLYEMIISSSEDGIISKSLQGVIVSWNKGAENIFGYSSKEAIGKNITMIIPDDLLFEEEMIIQKILKGQHIKHYDTIRKSKGGSNVFVSLTVSPIVDNDGVIIGVSKIVRNITEKKIAERRILASEIKYRALFEHNPMPMWLLDNETLKFLDVNEAAIKHYGYSRQDFLSMTAMDIRPPEDRSKFTEFWHNNNKYPYSAGIWRHLKKDGTIINAEVFVDETIAENKVSRLILIYDVTEKVKAEKEMIALTGQLRDLASHLQHIREEERAFMAREIHDELGQQLTALKMDVSWLMKKTLEKDLITYQKLQAISDMLGNTINTVRKISSELRPSILDDLGLKEAMEWHGNLFQTKTGIKINFNLSPVSLPKNDAAIALFRIFQESLTNVARHANATLVDVSLSETNGVIRLAVSDNGKGFDLGNRSHKQTLGLLGMKERAIMLSGTFDIDSASGKGTKVKIEIPV
ncbi:MAG TPA: PAS domain S-box protein [Panacibacter sp.]|nr:PAS domain S-box protein [Panacibacter sp.]